MHYLNRVPTTYNRLHYRSFSQSEISLIDDVRLKLSHPAVTDAKKSNFAQLDFVLTSHANPAPHIAQDMSPQSARSAVPRFVAQDSWVKTADWLLFVDRL